MVKIILEFRNKKAEFYSTKEAIENAEKYNIDLVSELVFASLQEMKYSLLIEIMNNNYLEDYMKCLEIEKIFQDIDTKKYSITVE